MISTYIIRYQRNKTPHTGTKIDWTSVNISDQDYDEGNEEEFELHIFNENIDRKNTVYIKKSKGTRAYL